MVSRYAGEDIRARIERLCVTEPNTGCWLWLASLDRDGYGRVSNPSGGTKLAHRASWEAAFGPVPSGLVLDHRCRVRSCVNPDHLRPMTIGENVRCGEVVVGQHLRATHCIRGHEFNEHNTYRHQKTGWRMCRICQRERYKENPQWTQP